jgi:SRSO17 transposase
MGYCHRRRTPAGRSSAAGARRRAETPIGYWLSNLPADTTPERLARLARLRWKIELDYKQLKGELGLDHCEGRSWLGWYHHTALVTAAHGFLTLERLNPFHPRPA